MVIQGHQYQIEQKGRDPCIAGTQWYRVRVKVGAGACEKVVGDWMH